MAEGMAGRSAIVAGAAQGIGRAVARRLAQAGATVILADPDERRLEAAVAEINAAAGDNRAMAFCCDLREKLAMTNLMAASLELRDAIDLLVDANLAEPPADAPDAAEPPPLSEGLEAAFAQNVAARLRLAEIAARRMGQFAAAEIARGATPRDRAILFVTAIGGRPAQSLGLPAASAAALAPLVRSLALRLAPQGLRANVLAVAQPARDPAAPLAAAAGPEAAAEAAFFLVSPAARAVTGQVLAADAGMGLAAGG